MNKLLQALGLMRVSEHKRARKFDDYLIAKIATDRDEALAKFKKAITDLAAAREEIAVLKDAVEQAEAQADTLRPDALAMRRKREMDRDRRKGKVS